MFTQSFEHICSSRKHGLGCSTRELLLEETWLLLDRVIVFQTLYENNFFMLVLIEMLSTTKLYLFSRPFSMIGHKTIQKLLENMGAP
jgi:hypothetical protein